MAITVTNLIAYTNTYTRANTFTDAIADASIRSIREYNNSGKLGFTKILRPIQ